MCFTLNTSRMIGLSRPVGIVDRRRVVVLENIFPAHGREGRSARQAASSATG